MTKGQGNNGFGAKWWLVSPSGTAITHTGSSGGSGSGSSGTSARPPRRAAPASGGWG